MREMVAKSVKLNRDLSKLLVESVRTNSVVKIGWGRENDPKPRSGELGFCPFLPEKGRIRILGDLANMTAACAHGGTFVLEGTTGSLFGAWNRGASISSEGDCGSRAGLGMSGGRLVIRGSAGGEFAAGMSGGLAVVRGNGGRRAGAGMSGGIVVILGDANTNVGCNMTGGMIVVNGRCPPPGEGAKAVPMDTKTLAEVNKSLEPVGWKVDPDAVVVISDESQSTEISKPPSGIDSRFDGITLVSSQGPRLSEHSPLDLLTLIQLKGEERGVLLPLPILPCVTSGKGLKGTMLTKQPCIVDSEPRSIDLMRITAYNLPDIETMLPNASGAVICLDSFPPLDDAELDALNCICRASLGDGKPMFLGGGIDRIDLVHRLAAALDFDAAIAHSSTPAQLPAAAALPMVGLSSREHQLTRKGITSGLSLPWRVDARDLLIASAAGSEFILANPFEGEEEPNTGKARSEMLESWLADLDSNIRGHLIELGEDGIDQLNRKHLRALDSDTANMTGIRLAGYDRPMPQWLGQ